jgi:potassium voltage-gated channel Shal-related subfamily D protein 2
MTPRSFLGRLITLPLLIFGLLLIALPSFVLGREFSMIWNDMTSGHVLRTPFMQSEVVRSFPPPRALPVSRDEQGTGFLATLRASQQHASEEHLVHAPAESSGISEHDETYHQLVQSQTALEVQLGELRAAMDTQGTLLRRIMERVDDAKGS